MKKMKNGKNQKRIILEKLLRAMAVLILKKYNPKVIGITGSVGKTSTKEAIFSVLSGKFRVRKNEKNYNNEVGIPLTIIGAESGHNSFWKWLGVSFKWMAYLIFPLEYPEVLVLEMGADRPGDMKYLIDFTKPSVGVITDVSFSHIEFFKTLNNIAKEKGTLIKDFDRKKLAVISVDNSYVAKLADQTKAQIIKYGFSEEAEMKATDVSFVYGDENEKEIKGISFKLNYKGTIMPVRLGNVLARHQIYSALAAASVGTGLGINLVEVARALENFSPPAGRMNLVKGIKNTFLIDDTYNSSPTSAIAALDTLGEIGAKRKIAVMGDILELGEETEKGHVAIARKFIDISGDIFFAVGKRMETAVSELKKYGIAENRIYFFKNPMETGKKLQEIMREGDLVLIKGSQGMRMEKITEEVMAEPQKAENLLCRQNNWWKEIPFKEV